jgi:pyruvate kinase
MSNLISKYVGVEELKTAIICTLAPAQVQTTDQIKNFIDAGMRIVRLNFSHIEELTEEDKENMKKLAEAKERSGEEEAKLKFLSEKDKRDRRHAWNLIRLIREAERELGRPIGIMMDLCGPRLRTGRVKDGQVEIKRGINEEYTFTSDVTTDGDEKKCGISPEDFRPGHDFVKDMERCFKLQKERLSDLKRRMGAGERLNVKEREEFDRLEEGLFIYINDGRLKFKVYDVDGDGVHCKILRYGILGERKGVNVPYCKLSLPPVTHKDERDLDWILKMEEGEKRNRGDKDFRAIDFIAESFVKGSQDIPALRGMLEARGRDDILVIVKIETPEALDRLQGIMEAADGVMVARGDLGVEISLANVPRAQRDIINKAKVTYGNAEKDYDVGPKFVIVATQMLESMIKDVQPLRAEVADINAAILEGADGIMTSAETIDAEDTIEVVRRMAEIAREAERERDDMLKLGYKKYKIGERDLEERDLNDRKAALYLGLAESACILAQNKKAPAIVVSTWSGRGAKIISSFNPRPKIIAITDNRKTMVHLLMYSGIYPVLIEPPPSATKAGATEDYLKLMQRALQEIGICKKGDVDVVAFFGIELGKPPIGPDTISNTVRLFRITS